MIDAASGHRKDAGTVASGKHEAREQPPQIAAPQRGHDGLSAALAALARQDGLSTPDYEWHVEMAAKGMAERDNHPMPKSVATPEAFYEVMAGAALDAIGLQALLERVARAEREPETTQEALRRADADSERTRHRDD
jgi:hypothetical protein